MWQGSGFQGSLVDLKLPSCATLGKELGLSDPQLP